MYIDKAQILDTLVINKDKKKCFIFDLDGTIIFDNKFLSLENESLLQLICDAGHELIFATGRPLKDFKTVMPLWTHNKSLTLFSGGVSISNADIIRSHAIPRKLVEEILDICFKNNYRFIMDNLSHYFHPDVPGMIFGILDTSCSKYRVKNIEQMLDSDIYKILLFDLESMDLFNEYARGNDLLIKHHSYADCFDIVPTQCNKYLGVQPFIGSYANEDVYVFGNDFNDYELFTHFKNSILFGNIAKLQAVTKLNLHYDDKLQHNFNTLIHVILS